MLRACKRVVSAIAIFLALALGQQAFGNSLSARFTPNVATANSLWCLEVTWVQGEKDPVLDTLTLQGLGYTIPITYRYLTPLTSSDGKALIFHVFMSGGLNMSRSEQQPKAERVAFGENATSVPDDDGNPLLLRDPRGNPIFFEPGLSPWPTGEPASPLGCKVVATLLPVPPATTPPDPMEVDLSPIVHNSSSWYGRSDTVDYGGVNPYYGHGLRGNTAWIQTYPGYSWPSAGSGPDPLVALPPSAAVPATTGAMAVDDGAGSTTFEFRCRYYNEDGLPPKPWLHWYDDEYDSSRRFYPNINSDWPARETGVVLYLDLMNIFDPLDELYPNHRTEAYRPHFMRPLDPTTDNVPSGASYMNGVDYVYRLQPTGWWGVRNSAFRSFYAGSPYQDRAYIALLTGTYHYFFAASADHLAFADSGTGSAGAIAGSSMGDQNSWYLFDFNDANWGTGNRSSNGLDPSAPVYWDGTTGETYSRYLTVTDTAGNPTSLFMPRTAGRRYSTWGDQEKDDQIYVDRADRVPGNFETRWVFKYPYTANEHPSVSIALAGYGNALTVGGGRFLGTISPYVRAVNPAVLLPYDPEGGMTLNGNRTESAGITSGGNATFRVKYFQRDNKPPQYIKTYINNQSFKVIDATKLSEQLLNGGYTGHTMKPAVVQTSAGQSQVPPYDYSLGVDYEYSTSGAALGYGPHTYFFGAYDGTATAIFPARPEDWTYNGYTYIDFNVPGYTTGDIAGVGYDNNYCPGPYVNHACQLSNASVTPSSGVKGHKFVYRVFYSDADNQRPYQAKIEVDTDGTTAGRKTFDMIKEDPSANTYALTTDTAGVVTGGAWYVFDSSTVENLTFADGLRHFRFIFVDDWGRQADPNDYAPGETVKLPVNGDWMGGPTIGQNFAPRLRNGQVVSADGTSNSATTWNFSVDYKDKNNDPPSNVTVYIGERQTDGTTIVWDSGHDMTQSDPSDTNYIDGASFAFTTRLKGNDNPVAASTTLSATTQSIASKATRAPDVMSNLSPTLANGNAAYVPDQVILRFKPGTSSQARAQAYANLGVQEIRPLHMANTYLVKNVGGSTVAGVVPRLTSISTIADGGPNYYRYPTDIPNDPYWDKLWGMKMIHAPAAWDVEKGSSSVTVAVVDTGVSSTHPDLQGRLLAGIDIANGDSDPSPSTTDPESGHGTHVAGTIAAQGDNGVGVVGVCWNGVKILPVKVFPDSGGGATSSDIIDGLQYAMEQGAQVVNLSLGGPGGLAAEGDKIHELTQAGIIVVAAAGNDGAAGVSYPAAFADSIAVSAVDENENLTAYSNFGPEIDIAAPGGEDLSGAVNSDPQIWSTWYAGATGNGYAAIQGTSMAAPHVAGAAALLLSHGYSATEVKDRLMWGARTPASGVLVPWSYGHGILDLTGALNATAPVTPPGPGTVALGTYYYAFEASDGAAEATWVPADATDEESRSESAGCLIHETLTTTDNVVYHCSKTPIVGTLPSTPVRPGLLIDPVVHRWPNGDSSQAQVISRVDTYVCKGWSSTNPDPYLVYRYDPVDAAILPSITEVLGVYLTAEMTGTNYLYAEDGSVGGYDSGSGIIFLGQPIPSGTNFVWIKYRHGGAGQPSDILTNTGDYILDRSAGTFTFVRQQAAGDVFKVDYYFTTRSLTDPTTQGTIGPVVGNTPPTLTSPLLSAATGDSLDDFKYSVIYTDVDGPNGQSPSYVRVVIDGVPYDMTAVSGGTPSFKAGVIYEFNVGADFTTKLRGGSHDYYFEASDGLAAVVLDQDVSTLKIDVFNGPWLNDPPVLSLGQVNPDPQTGSVSAQSSVTYGVTYSDPDADAPYVGGATGTYVDRTPKVYVDNAAEVEYIGAVTGLVADPMEPAKYRGIQVSQTYAAGQMAGKLMQITSGTLAGTVYLIASNDANTLTLMTDGLSATDMAIGTTYVIGSLRMNKSNTAQQDFVNGVAYEVTAPQLAVGSHTYHFKAASILTPPVWLTPAPTMSDWVKFPLSGENSGPTVAIQDDLKNPNHSPVLAISATTPYLTPLTGEPSSHYVFAIKYSDADGDPPSYHNRLLGYVRVVFNDGSYTAAMATADSGSYVNGRLFTVATDHLPSGTHKFHFEASDGKTSVRYPTAGGYDPTAADFQVAVGSSSTTQPAGLTRVVATVAPSSPDTSAPVVDMVSAPAIIADGTANTLWGATRAALLHINIWNPVTQKYDSYGTNGSSLPQLQPGMAMWIQPEAAYPAEGIQPSSPPTPVSATDILDYNKQYRLLKPVWDAGAQLYSQTSPCPIALKAGWNQMGSPYLLSTGLASSTVTYQGQTVSFNQATENGWVKGYAWMWDPAAGARSAAQGYKLVHPSASGALRTIDPWRGYWIKAVVDCTLTLSAP